MTVTNPAILREAIQFSATIAPMVGLLNLEKVHEPLATFLGEQLEQVSLIFERQLASDMDEVNKLCLHIENYRGKMLRPTLVLLSGLAAGNGSDDRTILTEKHRIVAAVTELIHMATLVHDDVLDEADTRRRGATVNRLWGNESAVILGDYLISNAFHLCSTAGDPAINLALGEVTNTMCEGELVQLHHRNNYNLDESLYLEIIRRKTASLIGECCRLGAVLSGMNGETEQTLKRFGTTLGIAFQIQDDLLDLIGNESVVGKSLGTDLEKGKLTLPIIYWLETIPAPRRKEAKQLIHNADAASLRSRLLSSGVVDRTTELANQLVREAKDDLIAVEPGPARDFLGVMADSVVSRTY